MYYSNFSIPKFILIALILLIVAGISQAPFPKIAEAANPVAVADTFTVAEDSGGTALNVIANDTDADGNDTLSVSLVTPHPNGKTVIVDAGEGNRDVEVTYTPNADFFGTDMFGYMVTDGTNTDTGTVTVTVTSVPDDPTAAADTATTAEDTAVDIDVTANDSDGDGDTFTVTAVSNLSDTGTGASAVVKAGSTSTVTYTPGKDVNGTVTFNYTLTDSTVATTLGAVNVTVTAVADDPTAAADSATTAEDTAVDIDVTANDSDGDGDTFTVTAVSNLSDTGTGASAVVKAGSTSTVTYTPGKDVNGTVTFNYTLTDSTGATALGAVNVTVTAVADDPTAAADSATTAEDTAVDIDVTANDTDGDGDTFTVTAVSNLSDTGTGADVVVKAGSTSTVTYTPGQDVNGTVTFNYTLTDSTGATALGAVNVTVTAVADDPTAAADSATTAEDTAVDIDVTANDTDVDGDTYTVTAVSNLSDTGTGADVVVKAGSTTTVTYTPGQDVNGTVTFNYTLTDSTGATALGAVNVTVTAVADDPTAAADSATTAEDTAVDIDVTANDTDVDGDTYTVTAVSNLSDTGTGADVVVKAGSTTTVTYTPGKDVNGTVTFNYTLTDSTGATALGAVNVTVTAVADDPTAAADSATTAEDTAVDIDVTANDTDVDGDTYTVTAVSNLSDTGTGADVVVKAGSTTTVTYTPGQDVNGTVTFNYTLTDSTGATALGAVNVTVTAVADDPTAAADSATTAEDTAVDIDVTANDTDVDGDTFTVTAVSNLSDTGTGASAVVKSGSTTTVTYTPGQDVNGTVTFNYTLTDSTGATALGAVNVTVTAVADDPTAAADSATTAEDTAVDIDVTANDSDGDGDTFTVTAVSNLSDTGTGADVVVKAGSTSTVTYTPGQDVNGTVTFNYTLTDSTGATALGAVNVTVTAVADDPTAAADSATTAEDTAVDIDVTANDTDVDGDTYTVTAVSNLSDTGTGADVVVKAGSTTTVTYTPGQDVNGTVTFNYTLTDSTGATALGAVNVTVTAVADDPTAAADSATTAEDTAVDIDVTANDTDVDGDTYTVTAVSNLSDTGTGADVVVKAGSTTTVTYTPGQDVNGTVTFNYTLTDSTGATALGAVNVTVTAVADDPTAAADSATTAEDTAVDIDVTANDTDVDGDTYTVTAVSNLSDTGTGADVVVKAGSTTTVTYTPGQDVNGTVTFNYTLTDSTGATALGAVNVTVTAVADDPTAAADSATTAEDTAVDIDVTANDTDVDGDTYTVTAVSNLSDTGTGADVVVKAGSTSTVTYTPGQDVNGTVTFNYTLTDSTGATALGAVNVTVTAVNDDPVAENDTGSTLEDTAVDINVISGTGVDTDIDGDTLSIATTNSFPMAPTKGTVAIKSGSTTVVTYTPNPDYNGTDTFDYTVSDGTATDTGTVSVTITAVNDPPVAVDDEIVVNQNQSATEFDIISNDMDVDEGDTRSLNAVTTPDDFKGTAEIAMDSTTKVTYKPATGFVGDESFTYVVIDSMGATDTGTVNVLVNSPPKATDDTATTDQGTPVDINVIANDSDVDGHILSIVDPEDPMAMTFPTKPTKGNVVVKMGSTTTVTYTPNENSKGEDFFTYTVTDGPLVGVTPLEDTGTVKVVVLGSRPAEVTLTPNDDLQINAAVPSEVLTVIKPPPTAGSEDSLVFPTGAKNSAALFQVVVDFDGEGCGFGPSGRRVTDCVEVDLFNTTDGAALDAGVDSPFTTAELNIDVSSVTRITLHKRSGPDADWTEIPKCETPREQNSDMQDIECFTVLVVSQP